MAKVSKIVANKKKKEKSEQFSKRRDSLKKITDDISQPMDLRIHAMIKLSELPRNSSKVRYRNRCEITGRPRGYIGKFGLSRITLRELASWGKIPGLKKSSW
jgi:small subunit ribosomal protein S14